MKQLKQLLFSCLTLFVFINNGAAQDTSSLQVKSHFTIGDTPIFHKITGELISNEEFRKIINKNPRVNLEKEVGERGEIVALIYNPDGSNTIYRDPSRRAKPGQPFPQFIFTTTNSEELGLKDLAGKVVVLHFNFAFEDRFASKQKFADFEKVLKGSSNRDSIVPIIVTHSNEEKISAFKEKVYVPYDIVANGVNFFDKYHIIKAPSYIVIKKDGTLGAYADDLIELKQALLKAK